MVGRGPHDDQLPRKGFYEWGTLLGRKVGIRLGGKFEAVYARVVHVGKNDSLLRGIEIRGYRVVCLSVWA